MDHIRTRIWDHLFRSGPQTIMQIASSLHLDEQMVTETISHEWFDTLETEVRIAVGKAPGSGHDVLR